MNSFADRMIRAARLDASLYEEVERDQSATAQALAVVVLAALATGIGARGGLLGLAAGVIASLIGWYLWSALTYWIGTRLLAEPSTQATMGELLRTIGFAQSPGILRVLGVIPGLDVILALATAIWMLVAAVVAIRQALDYQSTGRAVLVVIVGWLAQLALLALVFTVLAGRARPALTGCQHSDPWPSRLSTRCRTGSWACRAPRSSTASTPRPRSRFPSPATWCAPRTPWCSSIPGCRPAPCPACSATTLARFTDADLLVHRLDALGLQPSDVDLVVISHLHYDHAGGAELFAKSELIVQRDEYAAAHYPPPFFASFYYRKNFDLPGYRWRLLDPRRRAASRSRRRAVTPPGRADRSPRAPCPRAPPCRPQEAHVRRVLEAKLSAPAAMRTRTLARRRIRTAAGERQGTARRAAMAREGSAVPATIAGWTPG